ncbi:adenylate/guanylate cyclase domain-containing protein [Leptolyngbya sp. DQ-M1]|uniref:CHASE2 domain-containing protein n=1 Tax=Leptolyngbya sp. DQ-M1 TaxID=2933920 RepID=UPI0032974EBE
MIWTRLKRQLWHWRGVVIAVPSVTILVLGLRFLGALQMLELAMLDQFFLMRPSESRESRIVIVEITEQDLRNIKRTQLSDAMLAQVLTNIRNQKPRAIGLDIYRDLPVEQGIQKLNQVFSTTPNLVGVQKIAESVDSSAVAPPPILKQRDQVGANDLPIDGDGKIRRSLLYLDDSAGNTVFSFSFKLALLYLEKQGIQPELTPDEKIKLGQAIFPSFASDDGGYQRAEAGGYQVLLNYRGQIQQFPTISLTEVIRNRIPAKLMRDRIVLIGSTAESLKDLFYTPYSSSLLTAPKRTPGVVIHANAISQILSAALEKRSLIHAWNEPVESAWIIGWAGLGVLLIWCNRSTNQSSKLSDRYRLSLIIASILTAGGGLVLVGYAAFLQGLWIPVVPPLIALTGSAMFVTAYIARTAAEIRKTFGRYLTDQVVASLLENPEGLKIGGERRKITILTSDLRGFTATAEQLPPEEVVKILNIYLAAMTDVITAYQGTIDEFMGDGILVLFGAPTLRADDSERAIACAIAMQQALIPVNEKLQQLGWSALEMGIGIHTGEVVVGNIGSEKRTKYSVIGSHVNLTYRIESFTIGGQILISESTAQDVSDALVFREVQQVQAKGIKHPITVYDVSAIRGTYNLALPERQESLVSLPRSIPLQYAVLDGKQINGTWFKGALIQLSERGGEIQIADLNPETFPAVQTNLKLNLFLPDEPAFAEEDIYVKVLKVSLNTGLIQVYFTARSPYVKLHLEQLFTLSLQQSHTC